MPAQPKVMRQGSAGGAPAHVAPVPTLKRHASSLGGNTPRAVQLSRDAAMAFYMGDTDGDEQLSLEEFMAVVPEDMKTTYMVIQSQNSLDGTLTTMGLWCACRWMQRTLSVQTTELSRSSA